MARLLGPDPSVKTVFLTRGAFKGQARAQGLPVTLYLDDQLTLLADIQTPAGVDIFESEVLIDAYSQIPDVLYPDGVRYLYTSIGGGPVLRLPARISTLLESNLAAVDDLAADLAIETEARVAGDAAPVVAPTGLHVKDFGAVGDGVTDDTAAITAAEAAMVARGGGVLQFGNGTYLTGPQTIHDKVVWQGEGRYSTIIKLKAASNADLLRTRDFATLTGTNGVGGNLGPRGYGLRSLTLDANRTQQTARSRCYVSYGWNHTVWDVNFINGHTGGVHTEWVTSDTTGDHMEGMWENFKIWNYGGVRGGAIGLDWSGPHDSMLANYVIATLDSTIRPYQATYGATPIDAGAGATATFPGSGTFTFTTTEPADPVLFPESGGWFLVPHETGNSNFSTVTYTAASTTGGVTTFTGCSGANGRVVSQAEAGVGIIKPSIGLHVNGTSKGEFGLLHSQGHIWGRNHIGMTCKMLTAPYNDIPIFSTNVHVEGSFLANVIMSNKSVFVGGSIYGTFAQAGNAHEVGILCSLPNRGAELFRVQTLIYNVGKTGGVSTCVPVMNVNSDVFDLDVQGTTNTTEYLKMPATYRNRSRVRVSCQNNAALSCDWFPLQNPIPVFWGGIKLGSIGGFEQNAPRVMGGNGAPPTGSIPGKVGDIFFRLDGTIGGFIYRATAITSGNISAWTVML